MNGKREKGLKRLVSAAGYSAAGLAAAWRKEEAFRLECMLSILLIPGALWLGETAVERAMLIGSWMFVITTELINSAIEAVVDRIGRERHELSETAKDMGSAAVSISLALAAVVWGFVALERFSGL